MLGVRGQAFALACVVVAVPAGAQSAPVVDLHGGSVALQVAAPSKAPDGFSSGAAIDLNLPDVSMNAQATASVGMGDSDIWRKQEAKISASLSGPAGTGVTASGSDSSALSYRDAASMGAPGRVGHLIASQSQSTQISASAPIPGGATVEVGADGSSTQTTDASAPQARDHLTVGTQAQEAFARLRWHPAPWLGLQAGAAARTTDVNLHRQLSRTSTYTSVDPRIEADVTPWLGGTWTTSVEHAVSPYDTAAYTAYASVAQPTDAVALQPDHAWRLQSSLHQELGPVQATVSYTADRDGTATEFTTAGGQQVPASTTLISRDQIDLAVAMPLDAAGLPETTISSEASWRDSRVVDPITADVRRASGQTPHHYAVRVVKNLPATHLSLGLVGEINGGTDVYQSNEVSAAPGAGTLGAFVSFKPPSYEVDLNVNGVGGAPTTDYFYNGTRSDLPASRTALQPAPGPMISLSLRKAF
ncbi:MAG: hypothetical protein KGJ78_09810 [Alphaproteobacteria bacterium]|nr:hypothetical protein [Alphaproteobacteria bacterium]